MSEQPGRERLREANAAVERDRDELVSVLHPMLGAHSDVVANAILAAGWVSPAEARRREAAALKAAADELQRLTSADPRQPWTVLRDRAKRAES